MKKKPQKNFLKQYSLGLDKWALVLFAIIILPNIIAGCVPAFSSRFHENGPLEIAAIVFQVFAIALLVFVVRRERESLSLSLPIVVALLALICDWIAWIFFFCNYLNVAVWLFLAVMPCIALICFEIERKNVFALPFTVIFSVLHIVSTCIVYL